MAYADEIVPLLAPTNPPTSEIRLAFPTKESVPAAEAYLAVPVLIPTSPPTSVLSFQVALELVLKPVATLIDTSMSLADTLEIVPELVPDTMPTPLDAVDPDTAALLKLTFVINPAF
ncbi:hypothetical protein ACMAUO_20630 [Gluconacetobacter sp. Hr-1-5]|uniref:hypothetical protein n=1 Tax=Gluconacetobacter sp. Hr-1-5 TaxID=3395370 RepID=UPI003B520B75